MSSPSGSSRPKPTAIALTYTIAEPPLFAASALTKVRCPGGSGTVGTICAKGTAIWDTAPLMAVWAKVYAVGTTPPATHPVDGSATQGTVAGNNWTFLGAQEIPVIAAACPIAPPTAPNGLFAVWFIFTTGTGPQEFGPETVQFGGVCSSTSDCGDGAGGAAVQIAQATTGSATVETAPRQWQVKAEGFRGPAVAHFNTTWLLSLRPASCGCIGVWDNDGDGLRTPRVELRCDCLAATEWHLTLANNGSRLLYTCPAGQWNALGVNSLVRANEDGDGLPDTLILTPV